MVTAKSNIVLFGENLYVTYFIMEMKFLDKLI